jgi:lipopolysaccharide/colanic/teichoic acid biosynthesis glycosyltransferase
MRPAELCAPERLSGPGVAHSGAFQDYSDGAVAVLGDEVVDQRVSLRAPVRVTWPAAAESGPSSRVYVPVKVALEWLVAAMLLVLCAPLIAFLAAAVKLTSRGPAFYLQTRLGLDGKTYLIWKLRTMEHNCEALTGPVWAAKGDARITPIGRLLRNTHLDELPQLWNVLRGDMSLIGPRPERPEIVARIERHLPGYRGRLTVRPGVTGLAQMILPPDSDIEGVRLKLAHDLYYIRHIGPVLDARIAACTAFYFLAAAAQSVCSAAVGRYGKAVKRAVTAEAGMG